MTTGLELRSLITKTGELELSLAKVETQEPGPDQVVVKVEASPINPSDLGLLTGPADLAKATTSGSGAGIKVTAPVPQNTLPFSRRVSTSRCRSATSAGTVIKAGPRKPPRR